MGANLVLIDGYSLLHRAFYALPMLTTTGGEPTNAIYGFASMLVRLLEEERPQYVAVAVDLAAPTFRHRRFEAYKAQRPSMPDQLRSQVARFEQLIRAFAIPAYGAEGFEADDVIGTLTRQALESDPNCRVLIVTGDRDALQLVEDRVTALITRKGIKEVERFTPDRVQKVLGIRPQQIVDLKGLVGDASDNIPGVPGIGEKTALELLQRYPDLEAILQHLEELPARVARRLAEYQDQAALSRYLATIVTSAPVRLDWEACRLKEPDSEALVRLLVELEFRTLLARLARMYPSVARAAARIGRGEATGGEAAGAERERTAREALAVSDGTGARPGTGRATADGRRSRAPSGPDGAEPPLLAEAPPQPDIPEPQPQAATRPGMPARRIVAADPAPFGLPRLVEQGEGLAESMERLAAAGPAAVLLWSAGEPVGAPAIALAVANAGDAILVAVDGGWPSELQPLARWLGDEKVVKWTHDAKSAAVALGVRGVRLAGVSDDIMLSSYLIDPGHGTHSLEEIALAYQGRVLQGGLAGGSARGRRGAGAASGPEAWAPALLHGADEPTVQAFLEFARERLEVVWNLTGRLQGFLAEDGLLDVYRRIELPLWPVLADMELTGVRIDIGALQRLGEQLAAEIERTAEEIYRLAGERFNINSPRQLSRILFEKLKLPVLKETKTGPSTSADVLEELAAEHEIVLRILDYRQLVKLKGTYVDPMPALVSPRTLRLHTTFHQAVTATGRLSSSNPNLQNIPVRTDQGAVIREAFVAGEPGWLLMSADYSQIELRVLAHMAGDPALIEAFRSGQDIHTRTASEVFNVPMEAVTPAMRSGAKAINFGIVYGISPYGLARGTGLSREDAKAFIESYFQRYPGVKAYLDRTVQQARERGYVTTLFGRRRYLPEIYSRQRAQRAFAERMAMNTPIQGTAADIMKMAMIAVHRRLKEGGWRARMVLQVHDELLLELPEEEVPRVGSLVKETMEGVVELAVPLVAEVKTGRSWRECK